MKKRQVLSSVALLTLALAACTEEAAYKVKENEMTTNDAYAEMTAVKNGEVKLVDADTTSHQGPRLVEGIESIAEAIYPEVFNEK